MPLKTESNALQAQFWSKLLEGLESTSRAERIFTMFHGYPLIFLQNNSLWFYILFIEFILYEVKKARKT